MSPKRDLYAANVRDVKRQLRELGKTDLIVGIPSYQEADNIAHVVQQADVGLREYFPGKRCAIVNVDNNSPDGTRDAFLGTASRTPLVYISTPKGAKGKGNNFWNLFHAARLMEAEAIVAVDADLISITPEWIRNLAAPILEDGCDYITPIYARNEYDGTITNNICYPLLYSLLGKNLRQPIGGDFGLSTRLSNAALAEDWQDTTRDYGIDIFLTTTALLGGFEVGQTHLGAKVHKPSAPKLGPMFTQVVTTLFTALIRSRSEWASEGHVETVPSFDGIAMGDPQSLSVDYKAIVRSTVDQYAASRRTLEKRLRAESFAVIDGMMERGRMSMDTELWCLCVFDLLHGFGTVRKNSRGPIVEALKPLFFARVATFYRDTMEMGHRESEGEIVKQAQAFRAMRDYIDTR